MAQTFTHLHSARTFQAVKLGYRLGLMPTGDGRDGSARASALASALSTLLGTLVELHHAADYRVLISAFEQGLVDFAWAPPLAAARAIENGVLKPAAIMVRNGTTSYMTALFTRRSSPIKMLEDLRGVRAAWVDRESASGYVVIRAALRAAGVSLTGAFTDEFFLRSHAEVARAVHEGRVDVGATCFNFVSGTFDIARSGYESDGRFAHEDIRILAHAGPIPSDIFAVHKSVPSSVISILQTALVDARPFKVHDMARALMQADGLVRPTSEHLAMLRRLLLSREGRKSIVPEAPR